MATTTQINNFIAEIAPIVQKYAKARGYKVASPIIAQACIESAYGTSSLGYKYHNYFGMKCGSSWKGKSVNLKTKEEYTVGKLTTISDNFRVYDSMDAGVSGYFDFISSARYANLKSATSAKDFLEKIKADGYATSSTYVATNMNVVNKYNLERFDNFSSQPVTNKVYTQCDFINDVCKILGVVSAEEALPRTVTISTNLNRMHPLVTPLERYMKTLGYYNGAIEADAGKTPIYGSGMASAIMQYQRDIVKATKRNQDGYLTLKGATWKKMLGL